MVMVTEYSIVNKVQERRKGQGVSLKSVTMDREPSKVPSLVLLVMTMWGFLEPM